MRKMSEMGCKRKVGKIKELDMAVFVVGRLTPMASYGDIALQPLSVGPV